MQSYGDPEANEAIVASERRSSLVRRKRLDVAFAWLRSCAVCGSFLPPIDFLCPLCWAVFERLRNRRPWLEQPGYPFRVFSLLTWTNENDAFVKPFIYGLKRGYALGAFERLTGHLIYERKRDAGEGAPLFIHPPPSGPVRSRTQGRAQDHAGVMSALLAEAWGTHTHGLEWDLPAKTSRQISQKRLSAAARLQRRFAPCESVASFAPTGRTLVFVDDVITTGATMNAAATALGNPEHFEAWTLICRPKLAGRARF